MTCPSRCVPLAPTDVVAVVGARGSGKSTLLDSWRGPKAIIWDGERQRTGQDVVTSETMGPSEFLEKISAHIERTGDRDFVALLDGPHKGLDTMTDLKRFASRAGAARNVKRIGFGVRFSSYDVTGWMDKRMREMCNHVFIFFLPEPESERIAASKFDLPLSRVQGLKFLKYHCLHIHPNRSGWDLHGPVS